MLLAKGQDVAESLWGDIIVNEYLNADGGRSGVFHLLSTQKDRKHTTSRFLFFFPVTFMTEDRGLVSNWPTWSVSFTGICDCGRPLEIEW